MKEFYRKPVNKTKDFVAVISGKGCVDVLVYIKRGEMKDCYHSIGQFTTPQKAVRWINSSIREHKWLNSGPKVLKDGQKTLKCGEGVTQWWLLPRTSNQALELLENAGKTPWSREGYYRGPGQWFSHGASIRHSRSFTLVTQSSGLDV